MEGPSVAGFFAASTFFVSAVDRVPDEFWERPALGTWSVMELVAHTNRAFTTIEEYLLRPVPPEPKESTYFSEGSIAERGRAAVEALGNNPKEAVVQWARRVTELVRETPGNVIIGSPVRTMTLGEYLPSRTAELTIHGLDLAQVLDIELSAPVEALAESLAFVGKVGALRGSGITVLRALSGRGELPIGFSVY